MSGLLIRNGRVIDPANGVDGRFDVLVRDGVIAGVDPPGAFADVARAEEIDASGLIVAPGLIDLHVHLREPGQTWKETIATGTAAAATGGFTSVVAMPNTTPVNDSAASLRWMLSPGRAPVTRLFAMPAATLGSLGRELTDFEALAKAGAVGFTDDGKPILDDDRMRQALIRAARLGLVVSQHAEDTSLTCAEAGGSTGIHAGAVAFRLGLRGMSVEAEARIVARDLRLLEAIEREERLRPRLHVQHVSTARAVDLIRQAKARNLDVTAEAAPHHFTLTDEAVAQGGFDGTIAFDSHAKMNPPLRPEADRQALIAGLADGAIDAIATDHAPHARHEKEVEFDRAANGVTGLETSLGLALRVLHREHGMPLAGIVRLMSTHPARIAGLKDAGSLRPGAWADLTLFDPDAEWSYSAAASLSKSKNSPFDGAPMLGRVRYTIIGGRIIHPT